MDSTSLDYLDVCALQHGIDDRDNPMKLLKLAIELELQAQATKLAQQLMSQRQLEFPDLCGDLGLR